MSLQRMFLTHTPTHAFACVDVDDGNAQSCSDV